MAGGDIPGRVDAAGWWRMARVLLPLEAAVGLVALVSAALLGGAGAPPLHDVAEVSAAPAGSPLLLTTAGRYLLPVAIAPGLPGPNRVVVGVEDLDASGVAQPAPGVTGVLLHLACSGCGRAPQAVTLAPSGAGSWYAGTVTLTAGSWTVLAAVESPAAVAATPVTASIEQPAGDDLLVGVPADLSGPFAAACQNHAAGLELGLAGAAGPRPRVILDDIETGGAAAAADRLAARGARVLAAPCGEAGTLGAVAGEATRLRLPLVGGLRSEGPSAYDWPTGVDQAAEGAALARQVRQLGAAGAVVVSGPRPEQAAEAAATEAALAREGLSHAGLAIAADGDPAALAGELRARDPQVLVLIATPRRALPVVEAVTRTGWRPSRGIVASSDLMSVSFTEDAGPLLGGTAMTIASELDPGDPSFTAYAGALRRLTPLRPPGIEGARGYYTGLVVEHALAVAGPHPSGDGLEHALRTTFDSLDLGLFRLGRGDGGGAGRLAFFAPSGAGRFVREGAAVVVQ